GPAATADARPPRRHVPPAAARSPAHDTRGARAVESPGGGLEARGREGWMLVGFGVGALLLLLPVAAAANQPAGRTARVSVSSTGRQGRFDSFAVAISADGRYVAFSSESPEFVAGDTNQRRDAFVRDRRLGRTTRVSVSSTGAQGRAGADRF